MKNAITKIFLWFPKMFSVLIPKPPSLGTRLFKKFLKKFTKNFSKKNFQKKLQYLLIMSVIMLYLQRIFDDNN